MDDCDGDCDAWMVVTAIVMLDDCDGIVMQSRL
jgi:hypothetical protein